MYTKWTAHLKDEHSKAQFEADLRRAKPVLDRLYDVLEDDITTHQQNEVDFDTPAWPYKQAYIVGAKKTLRSIQKLIDLDKQKDN